MKPKQLERLKRRHQQATQERARAVKVIQQADDFVESLREQVLAAQVQVRNLTLALAQKEQEVARLQAVLAAAGIPAPE